MNANILNFRVIWREKYIWSVHNNDNNNATLSIFAIQRLICKNFNLKICSRSIRRIRKTVKERELKTVVTYFSDRWGSYEFRRVQLRVLTRETGWELAKKTYAYLSRETINDIAPSRLWNKSIYAWFLRVKRRYVWLN